MKDKLTILFWRFLCLYCCSGFDVKKSRLDKIQTGEIILNPNDLGAAGFNKIIMSHCQEESSPQTLGLRSCHCWVRKLHALKLLSLYSLH